MFLLSIIIFTDNKLGTSIKTNETTVVKIDNEQFPYTKKKVIWYSCTYK